MCEPLQGKMENDYISNGEMFWKRDIKSAVAFYKKYFWEIEKFADDYPKIYNEAREKGEYDMDDIFEFNCWLFDYTFKDVIE